MSRAQQPGTHSTMRRVVVVVATATLACLSNAADPPLVSVCGDPGMRQREPRVLLEGEGDMREI